jgi:hypothetical protein
MNDIKLLKELQGKDFIPPEWLGEITGQPLTFNPSILAIGESQYLLAYRVATSNGDFRRIACCILNKNYDLVPGSLVPLSNLIRFHHDLESNTTTALNRRAFEWHADPRLIMLKGSFYILWNDGSNKPYNSQFLMRLDAKGHPAGVAKLVVLVNSMRRRVEKNWMFFESNNTVFVEYCSTYPKRIILEADIDSHESVVPCTLVSQLTYEDSSYEKFWGEMRGGASPISWVGSDGSRSYLSIDHSRVKVGDGKVNYEVCAHEFFAVPPFALKSKTVSPLLLRSLHADDLKQSPGQLNPEIGSVIYPCGAILQGDSIIVSYGINDERMALASINIKVFQEELKPPIAPLSISEWSKPTNRLGTYNFDDFVPKVQIPIFWWNSLGKIYELQTESRWEVGNFGDIASKFVVEEYFNLTTQCVPASSKAKFLSTGSVLQNAQSYDVVWGSGLKGGTEIKKGIRDLKIFAVRGPLTLDYLRRTEFDISNIDHLFDPGCLVGHILKKKKSLADSIAKLLKNKLNFIVIPHFSDDLILRRRYPHLKDHLVSVDCSPAEMIAKISNSDLVVSTSLHGIIFAESLGIPACWLKVGGKENDFKYYDYYYGTSRFKVKKFDRLEDALRADPMDLPRFEFDKYLNTFPVESVLELGNFYQPQALVLPLDKANAVSSRVIVDLCKNSFIQGSKGVWSTKQESSFSIDLKHSPFDSFLAHSCVVEIFLTPYNSISFPAPQSIRLSIGDTRIGHSWDRGDQSPIVLRLPVNLSMLPNRSLLVDLETKVCCSPTSNGEGTFDKNIGVNITKLRLVNSTPTDFG